MDTASQSHRNRYSPDRVYIQPNGHMQSDEHLSAMVTLQNFISRFKYKPKWDFEFHESNAHIHSGFNNSLLMIPLTILFPITHCYGEKKGLEDRLNVRVSFRLTKLTPATFLEEMLKHIKMIEEHEIKEWLKFDNVRFEVPHLPGQQNTINPAPLGEGIEKMKFKERKEESISGNEIRFAPLRVSVNRTATGVW